MIKKNSEKKKNPIAQELRQDKYKQRVVINKKIYDRKKIKKLARILRQKNSFLAIFQARDIHQYFHH